MGTTPWLPITLSVAKDWFDTLGKLPEWFNGIDCEMEAALTVSVSYFRIDFAQLFHIECFSLSCIF